jgi:hypothetical protein
MPLNCCPWEIKAWEIVNRPDNRTENFRNSQYTTSTVDMDIQVLLAKAIRDMLKADVGRRKIVDSEGEFLIDKLGDPK